MFYFQSTEVYSEPYQTSKMERLVKPLTIFAKLFILDVWQGSEYATGVHSFRNYLLQLTGFYVMPILAFNNGLPNLILFSM